MMYLPRLLDKLFDKACWYNIAEKFIFLRVLGRIKSFGSVNLVTFYRVGRVTLNRGTFLVFFPFPKIEK